jgi:hypothetical protein
MRLCTSSFKTQNIAILAVILSLMMVLAYHLLIIGLAVKPGIADTPFKLNLLVVEDYEFKEEPIERIALGSSVLNRVVTQSVDTGCQNLCIKAFSALDGAAIIQHTGKYPRVAVIELSFMLSKQERYDFLSEVPEYKRWFSRYSPIVRTAYQPSSILLTVLKQGKGDSTTGMPEPKESSANGSITTNATTITTAKLPTNTSDKTNKSDRSEQKRPARMAENTKRAFVSNLTKLQADVLDLEKHGTKVCFVRVPLSSTLFDSERELEQMELCENFFPRALYPWIEWSGPQRDWQTFDGIHLKDDDAAIFAADMKKQLERVVQK